MLEISAATVIFDGKRALEDVDLGVEEGEIMAVMGPSGCGKTTLLRAIAGLQDLDRGTIRWRGELLDGAPPHRRGFGLMFQDYALFPHKSVAGNVAFGLRMEGMPSAEATRRVGETLALVGLEGYEGRSVGSLSGGEQQRVALARALAPSPELIMLDEPVGALDRTLRDRLVEEMREIFDRLRVTVLYVTHDRAEAFAVADRIAVMNEGRMLRVGRPEHVWRDPQVEFVASFLGLANIVPVQVHQSVADTGWVRIPLAATDEGVTALVLPPESVRLAKAEGIPATVTRTSYRGGSYAAVVRVTDGQELTVDTTRHLREGDEVRLEVDPGAVALLRDVQSSSSAV